MKRISICTMLAALLLGGCAKTTESGEYNRLFVVCGEQIVVAYAAAESVGGVVE